MGDSVELDYEMLVSLIKFGDDPELWQLDVNFYDLDGERVPGFPMSPPGMEFPLDEAMTISERIHADAIAWAEANPEWKKSWSKMDANARIVRLFLPMASLMAPGHERCFCGPCAAQGKDQVLDLQNFWNAWTFADHPCARK